MSRARVVHVAAHETAPREPMSILVQRVTYGMGRRDARHVDVALGLLHGYGGLYLPAVARIVQSQARPRRRRPRPPSETTPPLRPGVSYGARPVCPDACRAPPAAFARTALSVRRRAIPEAPPSGPRPRATLKHLLGQRFPRTAAAGRSVLSRGAVRRWGTGAAGAGRMATLDVKVFNCGKGMSARALVV